MKTLTAVFWDGEEEVARLTGKFWNTKQFIDVEIEGDRARVEGDAARTILNYHMTAGYLEGRAREAGLEVEITEEGQLLRVEM